MSATGDFDKAMCLAIKATSATHPLRIIDARPYINAQANALRGKGYENVGFLGGPTVAALAFMDIHNVRSCDKYLRFLYFTFLTRCFNI
jgi:hypothetical protein